MNDSLDVLLAPDTLVSSAASEYCADNPGKKIAKRGKPAEDAVWALMAIRLVTKENI